MKKKDDNIPHNLETLQMRIEGMDCAHCALTIEKGVSAVKGVSKAEVDFVGGTLTAHGEDLSPDVIEAAVRSMGYKATVQRENGAAKIRLSIPDMDCADEERAIRQALGKVDSIQELNFNLINRELTVTHMGRTDAIVAAIKKAGFRVEALGPKREARTRAVAPWKIWSLVISSTLILAGGLLNLYEIRPLVAKALILVGMAIGGWQIFQKGLAAARNFRLDMNFLMSAAVIGAVLIGEWSEAGAVVVLFALAQLLESLSLQRSRNAIGKLMDLSPRHATVIRDGTHHRVPIDSIVLGDRVFVKPGERIAVDGSIVEGFSMVDQATITGESIPVTKGPKDEVFAGTLNGDGAIEIITTHAPGDTTLDHIIRLVEEAQAKRAPSQSFVDSFSAIYTPTVVAIAAVIAVMPPVFFSGAWNDWIYRALALLVISCPCALVISTPITIVSALANAARHGVLVKGGAFLENAHRVRVFAFDKTGTITKGKLSVKAVLPIDGAGPEELIRLAASVEAHSEHPIARAILEHANRLGVTYAMPKNFKAFPGMGAMAEIDGETALVGKRAIFDGTDYLGRQAEETLDEIGKSAQTAILVGTKTRLYGVLAISDEIRPASARVLAELRRLGVAHTSLLTGDNVVTANVTGLETGFDSVYAELLPQQKAEIVRKLESEYGRIAMVGDGVNDAPALASGSIGIAMGAAGSDSALETADIALMADELERIPWLMRLSRKSRGIIIQNVATSIAVKFVFVALASAGLATLWMAVFADMGISLLVIFNGMRALRSL